MLSVPADDTLMQGRLIDGLKVMEHVKRYFENTIKSGQAAGLELTETRFPRRVV